jgi:hypothetical protein
MKRSFLSLLMGTAVLTTPSLTDLSIEHATAQALPNLPILSGVELSAQQTAQVKQTWATIYPQIQAILNPAQRNQFNAELAQGESVRNALMGMNLSLQQKLQLRQIMRSLQQQVSEMMTPQQQQQIEKNAKSLFL